MDKDKEVECGISLRLDIFNTYWNILKRNYKDTQHDEKDFKIYYSIFKEYEEKDFINAVKMVLKYQQYFPRIDEIVKYLSTETKDDVPKWFNLERKIEETSQQEKQELEELLEEIGG